MKIDGKALAEKLLDTLKSDVIILKEQGITPTLAVILVGDNPASLAYIRQKQRAAVTIGATVILERLPEDTTQEKLNTLVKKYNDDPNVHGLIIQRPLPPHLNPTLMYQYIKANKDVDGFVPNSTYKPPVALAVVEILTYVFSQLSHNENDTFADWLKNQRVAVVGKGETAGKPIAELLATTGCVTDIIHSKTEHPENITQKANIIISCVGKDRTIKPDSIMPKSILIGVGIWRDSEGKLRGDYEEEEIQHIASFYTPTPGGVGPVNVASLMKNVVHAAK